MRVFSDSVLQMLATQNISTFYIVDIGSSIKHTNYFRDLVTPFGTYSAENGLVGIDTPKMDSNLDREAYRIIYADPSFQMRAMAEQGMTGIPVAIRLGFINTSGQTVNGTAASEPFLNSNDFITSYIGVVDFPNLVVQEDEVLVTLECASPMASLNLVKPHLTSQNYIRSINSGDTSFDQVYQGSASINLLWGKK